MKYEQKVSKSILEPTRVDRFLMEKVLNFLISAPRGALAGGHEQFGESVVAFAAAQIGSQLRSTGCRPRSFGYPSLFEKDLF